MRDEYRIRLTMDIEKGLPISAGVNHVIRDHVVPTVRWLVDQDIEFDGPVSVDWQLLDYVFYDKSDAFAFILKFPGTEHIPSPA